VLRLDVVQEASNRVGDLELGTLTGGVDSTHPVDIGRTEPDGHWTNSWLTIKGIERRVTGFTRPGGFVTNAFPFVPVAGDAYELRKDDLHTRLQIEQFCNAAVRDVQFSTWVFLDSYLDNLGTPLVIEGTTAFPVPPLMDCVYSVLYQAPLSSSDPNWYPVSYRDWTVMEPEMITLFEPLISEGSRVRFLGTRRPREMAADTEACEVEPSFVAVYAAKLMALRMMRGADGDRMKTVYAALREEEQAIRKNMRIRQPNNIRRVRPTGTGATPGNVAIPTAMTRASQWYTGALPPTYLIGRPGDMYLQDDGTVWANTLPVGWHQTGTNLEGPPGAVEAAQIEYDALEAPLDVVPDAV